MNTNVQNFLFTVVVTFAIASGMHAFNFVIHWYTIVATFLLSYPWKMPSGNVYSLFGGSSDKKIYSLFGIYQIAEYDAFCLTGVLLYQSAGNATQIFGISFMQIAEEKATQLGGICFLQEGERSARQFLGIAGFQRAHEVEQFAGLVIAQHGTDVTQGFGICIIQSGQLYASQIAGIIFFQLGHESWADQVFGINGYQYSKGSASQGVGILIYQQGGYEAKQGFGIPLWQKITKGNPQKKSAT